MASRAGTIADWLTAWLNDPARGWPLTGWTATRTWDPALELEDAAAALAVQVSADGWSGDELQNRAVRQRDLTLFIDLRQLYDQTGAIPAAWLDARVELVEAIVSQLHKVAVTGLPAGSQAWVENAVADPLCDPIDIRELRQFTASIEVTIRELRQ